MDVTINIIIIFVLLLVTTELPCEYAFLILIASVLGLICGNKIVKDCRNSMYPDEEDDD